MVCLPVAGLPLLMTLLGRAQLLTRMGPESNGYLMIEASAGSL
jgi:hypothetical protein